MRNRVRLIKRRRPAIGGTGLITPRGLELRYGWTQPTRWRAEHDGRLPARDVYIGGKPVGWRPDTIAAAERGERAVATQPARRVLPAHPTLDAMPPELQQVAEDVSS